MNNEIIEKIIEYMRDMKPNMKEGCPISIIDIDAWEWAQGVGIYGIYKYWKITKKSKYMDYLIEWFDKNIKKGLPDKNINTMTPLLTLTYVYEYTENAEYLNICKEWAKWLMYEMPRIDFGGLPHLVSGWEQWGLLRDLWMDTLFMAVLFLQRMGNILDIKEYKDEAAKQFLIHVKYLQDTKTGLFFHGWSFEEKNNFAGALWGRGNCWYTAGVVDYIENSDESYAAVNDYLKGALLAQAEALKEYQDESGMWHTLINDENTYTESSATCGFAYGLMKASRMGMLPKEFMQIGKKAAKAVCNLVDSNGEVGGVSYGTGIGKSLDDYKDIPITPMAYGQALAVIMLTEMVEE